MKASRHPHCDIDIGRSVYKTLAVIVTRSDSPRSYTSCSKHPSSSPSSADDNDVAIISESETDAAVASMGKSNKFDYTNRPNSGAKLGVIIGSALEKEADKVLRDAEKQAIKTRKYSTGSVASTTSGNSAADFSEAVVHVLDIKVPSKQLGDEGACAIAVGLEVALRKGTREASVLLEDLNLTDNGLTTISLARLAPIIVLAKHDLKTLNLSCNNIKIETTEESLQWEAFLQAFRGCFKLRRLDLSGNQNLGSKALEILARIHIQEEAIVPMPVSGQTPVHSWDDTEDRGHLPTLRPVDSHESLAIAQLLKRRCGLRSLPYLTLKDIGLNDVGALWLSYVIEDHHYPSQLIDDLNAIPVDSTIHTYQQDSNFRGVDWNEETTLGKDGLFLLRKAEAIRQQTMFADQISVVSLELETQADATCSNNAPETTTSRSVDRRHSRAAQGDRRASIRSIRTTDGGEHELSELESARKKIQRFVIEKHGASSVELWRTGLRIAISARVLNGLGPMPRDPLRFYTGSPIFDFSRHATLEQAPPEQDARPLSNNNIKPEGNNRRQGTYAATLTANTGAVAGEPELCITEVTNSPVTPKLIFKPHRKGAFSDGNDLQTVTKKLETLIARDNVNPEEFCRWQLVRLHSDQDGDFFRNVQVPSHLPAKILERIAGETVPKRERELLSQKQRESAAAWGLDRASFDTEWEWRRMADSAQVWTLLESIACLEYQNK